MKTTAKITAVLCLLAFCSAGLADELLVPAEYLTIQAAINAAVDSDVVIVADGTYTGPGNRGIDFLGKAITVSSENGPENCIIDCENSGRGFYFHSGETADSVLDGFTITNGDASEGGGIHCTESSPTITNCIITGNTAHGRGGAIYCEGSNHFLTVTNCIFTGNSAADFGGGIYFEFGNLKLNNCTFSGNSAEDLGGGIFCEDIGQIFVTNSVFWANIDNSGVVSAAQINCMEFVEMPAIIYSCIQDANANDANIPFGAEANFNIDDDPCFVLPGYWDQNGTPGDSSDDFWVDGDYHLLRSSSCIEAGLPNFIVGPNVVDIDGQPRIMGLCVDMGADEFAPIIVVTKPQGGEVWANGSTHEINWASFGITGTVDIYYSSNGGADWLMIDNTTDSASYMWQLPGAADSNQCLVSVEPNTGDPNIACIESGLFAIYPDFIHPTVPSKWKSLGGDFDRAGLSENYGPELGCVKWQFQTDGPVSASPTVGAGDRVHIACEDGKLYTLGLDGSLLWSYDVNSPLLSAPSVGPSGSVYVGGKDGKLYAISITGRLRWTHNTEGFIYSSPALSPDGKVYACSQDGTLYALGRDGSELWTFETAGPGVVSGAIFASPAIGADGTVYIAGVYDPNLYAIDSNNGTLKWACNLADPCEPNGPHPWPFASPVIAPDGTIYQTLLYNPNRFVGEPGPGPLYEAVWYDSKLYAIDPNNGNILWATNMTETATQMEQTNPEPPEPNYWFEQYYAYTRPPPQGEGIPPYPYTATFVLGPDYVRYYRVSNSSFSEPALAPDGTIYVSFDDQYLRAVDPNGTIKWVTSLGWLGGFTLTVGSDGLIYAAGDDAHLYVLDPDGKEIARFQTDDWLSFPVIMADNTMIITDANNMVLAIGDDGCEGQIPALHRPEDLNTDWAMNFIDFTIMAADWLDCTDISYDPEIGDPYCDYDGDEIFLRGDINRDQYVNYADLSELANRWLSEE